MNLGKYQIGAGWRWRGIQHLQGLEVLGRSWLVVGEAYHQAMAASTKALSALTVEGKVCIREEVEG